MQRTLFRPPSLPPAPQPPQGQLRFARRNLTFATSAQLGPPNQKLELLSSIRISVTVAQYAKTSAAQCHQNRHWTHPRLQLEIFLPSGFPLWFLASQSKTSGQGQGKGTYHYRLAILPRRTTYAALSITYVFRYTYCSGWYAIRSHPFHLSIRYFTTSIRLSRPHTVSWLTLCAAVDTSRSSSFSSGIQLSHLEIHSNGTRLIGCQSSLNPSTFCFSSWEVRNWTLLHHSLGYRCHCRRQTVPVTGPVTAELSLCYLPPSSARLSPTCELLSASSSCCCIA